ncbi:unnamed protein product [Dovyalis caffra]|uniref:Uncharacterized protein n=1 Tax=Dovyalis caffra TaxID=77055 RepID=A0AAV1RJ89_9ROSI|nr:unnamed protein product [Dovyalis caffra]
MRKGMKSYVKKGDGHATHTYIIKESRKGVGRSYVRKNYTETSIIIISTYPFLLQASNSSLAQIEQGSNSRPQEIIAVEQPSAFLSPHAVSEGSFEFIATHPGVIEVFQDKIQ